MASVRVREVRYLLLFAGLALAGAASPAGRHALGLTPYKPTMAELPALYHRADTLGREYATHAFNVALMPHWYDDSGKLWYRKAMAGGKSQFVSVDCASGAKGSPFDAAKLAAALSKELGHEVRADELPFEFFSFTVDGKAIRFETGGQGYECDLSSYALTKAEAPERPGRRRNFGAFRQNLWPADTQPADSPDGAWTAQIVGRDVSIGTRDGKLSAATHLAAGSDYFSRIEWTPDSKRVIAVKVTPGDRKQVYLFESTPPDGGPARVLSRVYDRPGDKVDTFEIWLIDPSTGKGAPIHADIVDYGDLPRFRFTKGGHDFTYEKMDRGYQRWRLMEVDWMTGEANALIDEPSKTFVDSTSQYLYYCKDSDEMIYRSERTGWGMLYLVQQDGSMSAITTGDWVVRNVDSVDEKTRQIVFEGSGRDAGEDPYFIHYYRVNFDGSGLVDLTPDKGDHHAEFSPDGKKLVDTCSTVVDPPVHELRDAVSGKLITVLEKADISELKGMGWRPPEPFVAKGRDEKTDIYGVAYWPSNFDSHKSYPVIEDIYAGPQDSYVPKSFSVFQYSRALCELGFVVVQIDGMGTRNRGKAFQDVCWHDLADAGFPDRILWIKALAAKHPQIDLTRVGIYGTSAGGQNSTGALLFHPEFYKVAVSSCGCHDNRLDKIWWNEQWMGYPVGPWYGEDSNIDNAWRLKGRLLLFVGELDTNVPIESTYRLCSALEKAGKSFSFEVISGSDHTAGGPFGERERRDWFVRYLLGVQTPDWNDQPGGKSG